MAAKVNEKSAAFESLPPTANIETETKDAIVPPIAWPSKVHSLSSNFMKLHSLPWAKELIYFSGNLPTREAKAPWNTESFTLKSKAEARDR